jgi:hypothetical protein
MLDFDKLSQELQEDTKVDELNLLQKQLTLPAIKHKWVSRLIEQKRYLNNLQRKKKLAKTIVLSSLSENNNIPPGLPKAALEKKIENSESIQKIDQDIEETSLLIEYLEKVEGIFRSMTYDIKNIIDITRLETT